MKIAFVWLALLPLVAQADPKIIDCPATLEVRSSAEAPPGWIAINTSPSAQLDRVGFFDGPPAENASLVPDRQQATSREARDTWQFAANRARTIFAACFYRGSSFTLYQALGPEITSCTARYSVMRSGQRLDVINIECSTAAAR